MTRSRARAAQVVALLWLVGALPAPVRAQSPFPQRDGVLANGTDTAVSPARVNGDFDDLLGDPYGLDGLVLIVDDCNPDPEVYLDEALVTYEMADEPGRMYDDAVAWLVCYDPKFVGFFWAGNNAHAAALDAGPVQDLMATRMGEGNFTGAITAGIAEVARQLGEETSGDAASSSAPGISGSSAGSSDGSGGSPGDSVAGDESSGGDSGDSVDIPWGSIVAWSILSVVIGYLVRALLARRRAGTGTTEPDGASADWADFAKRLTALEGRLVPDSTDISRVVLAYEGLGDEPVLAVHRRHLANVDRVVALRSKFSQDNDNIVALDAAERVARLAGLSAEAGALEAYQSEIAAEAGHAEMLIERAGILAVDAQKAINETAGILALLGSQFPDPAALLAVARRAAEAAELALSTGGRLAAGRLAEESREIATRLASVGTGWAALRDRADASAATFARLDAFAPASWADVRGNGHEAEESADTVVAMLGRLANAAAPGPPPPGELLPPRPGLGHDEAAGFLASLEPVEAELARGARLLDALEDRLKHIEAARESARPAADAARAELAAAREWLARPEVTADSGGHGATTLAAAEKSLAEAEAAMSGELPDWPSVIAAISSADRLADEAQGEARAQSERIASLRRQASTAADAATSAVARAEGFNSSHTSDLGSTHLAKVARAQEAVERGNAAQRQAEMVSGDSRSRALAEAVTAFGEGQRLAEEAFAAMTADFDRLEARRTEYKPRRDWMAPVVPIPIDMRPIPFPANRSGWTRTESPRRQSSWGGMGGGSSSGSSGSSGSRPSSSRRGGGRSW